MQFMSISIFSPSLRFKKCGLKFFLSLTFTSLYIVMVTAIGELLRNIIAWKFNFGSTLIDFPSPFLPHRLSSRFG